MTEETTMEYATSDLNAAAYVVAKGVELTVLRPVTAWQVEFVFPPKAEALVREYFTGGMVEARDFAATLRLLKAQLPREANRRGQ